jgi:hypothetical protein
MRFSQGLLQILSAGDEILSGDSRKEVYLLSFASSWSFSFPRTPTVRSICVRGTGRVARQVYAADGCQIVRQKPRS